MTRLTDEQLAAIRERHDDYLQYKPTGDSPVIRQFLRAIKIMHTDRAALLDHVVVLLDENKDLREYIHMLTARNGCGDGCIGCEWCMPPECMSDTPPERDK